jgi:hypothetical protein
MRTYQANTQKIRPGKHRILGDKSWSEDWRWLIGSGGLQRRDCSGGRWALATVVSVTKNRSVRHISWPFATLQFRGISICHISVTSASWCHSHISHTFTGWQLMWQVLDVRCKLSALETTLLPKRLQQCLTHNPCYHSFNFIYCMRHSCVVLFRRNEE